MLLMRFYTIKLLPYMSLLYVFPSMQEKGI
jgi:hypothetical protein